jgi:hypothetical protein
MQRTADSAGGDAFLKLIITFSIISGARVDVKVETEKGSKKQCKVNIACEIGQISGHITPNMGNKQ